MDYSQTPFKTRKNSPKDEISRNADLLIRAGFIHKEMAGVYNLLPFGLRVVRKITEVIRQEMGALGAQELHLTTLQDGQLWRETGRWDDSVIDVWFKSQLKNGTEVGLAPTHEEPLTRIMKDHISSYRDLPVLAYQFQTKFRNELRAKSGIMRGREFLMKDLYSFSLDEARHEDLYNKISDAYTRIYRRLGIGEITYKTFSSGGSFARFSHEFQTISEAGEDVIYIDQDKHIAINEEVLNDEIIESLGLDRSKLIKKKAIEVGNIFTLGTRFSEPLQLYYKDSDGTKKPVFMGSYGIGITRLLGTIAEVASDDKGLKWPREITPYDAHLVIIGIDPETLQYARSIQSILTKSGIEVLVDDRDARAGEKFADADLIGIPWRLVVSDKLCKSGQIEVLRRGHAESEYISRETLISTLDMGSND